MKMFRLVLLGALLSSPALAAPVVPPVVFSAGGQPVQVEPVITVDTTGAYVAGGGGAYTGPVAAQLPASLGAKAGASSLSVVPNTDTPFPAVGNIAAGATDSGNPIKVGGAFNSTLPALTTGQRGDLQIDASSNLRARLVGGLPSGADGVANGAIASLTGSTEQSATLRPLSIAGSVFNGTTWDRQRGDVNGTYTIPTPTASANNALITATVAAATTDQLKASAGNVYSLNLVNSTTAGFVVLYDAAAAPTGGTALTTSLIRYCFPVAASAGFDKVFQMPVAMTNGASLLFSTSCTTYTAVSPAPIMMAGQAK